MWTKAHFIRCMEWIFPFYIPLMKWSLVLKSLCWNKILLFFQGLEDLCVFLLQWTNVATIWDCIMYIVESLKKGSGIFQFKSRLCCESLDGPSLNPLPSVCYDGKCHRVADDVWQPFRVSKARHVHRWFGIACLCTGTLDFLGGFPYRYEAGLTLLSF